MKYPKIRRIALAAVLGACMLPACGGELNLNDGEAIQTPSDPTNNADPNALCGVRT